jgi:hypothetical protein
MARPSIENLPVELFHRIFDSLDAQTILFSVQLVSRLFRSVVNSYDRYNLDFKIISKCNFHRLCRLIQPQHLISLTLYNNEPIPDQTSLFISNFQRQQLTKIRSINLFGIDEFQLNMILKSIDLKCLISFSLHIQKYESWPSKTTEQYLSSIMAQSTLRKVEFNLRTDRLSNIQWPSNCRIEYLIIDGDITMDNLFRIISSSPQLHSLIIKQKLLTMPDNLKKRSSFPQITSLILEKVVMTINQLELFLSLTPSLIYLKLIGNGFVFDGNRWEQFLQVNLPHLNKLEFFLSSWKLIDQTRDDLQLIIQLFQTPFWIEHKKWFVACEFHLKKPRQIQIYSIPICKTIFHDRLDSEICLLSTSNHLIAIEDINEIDLKFENPNDNNILKSIITPFPNVTKLRLDFYSNISIDSINYLRSIFNVSQLIEVQLEKYCFDGDNKDLLFDAIKLIEESPKLTSLGIHSRYLKSALYSFLNDLCSILPRQIKYLEIPIHKLEQVEIIFQRCPYLSIVKFETKGNDLSAKIAEWFEENTIDSMFRRYNECDYVWIGKKLNQINENPKRIKLMNNKLEC